MQSLLFREGIAIIPPQYHTLQVCGSSMIRHRQCYHTPFYHTPHYHTPYALLWVCGSAIAPRGLSYPLRGPCELLSPGLHKIPHTPQDTLSPGCGFLRSIRYPFRTWPWTRTGEDRQATSGHDIKVCMALSRFYSNVDIGSGRSQLSTEYLL